MKNAIALVYSLTSFIALMLVSPIVIDAQVLNHRQGEILIEIERNADAEFVIGKLNSSIRVNGFEAKQVAPVPMNIWKIAFDFASINEREVLRYTKAIEGVYNAQYNHLLSYRNTPNDDRFVEQWQYINI